MATVRSTNGTNGRQNGHGPAKTATEVTPYEAAVLGFRNYWYPVFSSGEIGKKPRAAKLLGDPIVFMRGQADGKVYAMLDECAHRGTRFSIGRGCEFPGTNTITCPYHGWTYDLETGKCVAVLPEGPESKVPGTVRMKTYPVQEYKGIVWIWMGDMAPVPLQDDLPKLMTRPDTVVKFRHNINYGNWRWHAENPAAGHAQMIHRDSFRMWFTRPRPGRMPNDARVAEDPDGIGVETPFAGRYPVPESRGTDPMANLDGISPDKLGTHFPGLGYWYVPPLWRRVVFAPWIRKFRRGVGSPVQGVNSGKMFMPGIYRQPQFPSFGDVYYEWWVAVDEDHYLYAQTACMFPQNPVSKLWKNLWYYLWGKPTGLILFNNQDIKVVKETTNYTKRRGIAIYPMAKASKNDDFHTVWRQFANENARGVGYKDQAKRAKGTKAYKAESEKEPVEAAKG